MPPIDKAHRRDERARNEPRRNVKMRPAAMRHVRARNTRFLARIIAAMKEAG